MIPCVYSAAQHATEGRILAVTVLLLLIALVALAGVVLQSLGLATGALALPPLAGCDHSSVRAPRLAALRWEARRVRREECDEKSLMSA
jgi:hypothetical protein